MQASVVNGNTATLVVPEGTCPVTVSFSAYALPGGQKLPFEEQVLVDNVTSVYGPGTYNLAVDAPAACAYQTDLYLGEVIYPLTSGAHHNHQGTNYLIKFDLVNLGQPCGTPTGECYNVDFENDADGQPLNAGTVIDDEYAGFGVTISESSGKKLLVFDTANPTGGDTDLRTPGSGSGNTAALGNALIISEDGDESDPDDDASGGTMVFEFAQGVDVEQVNLLDIDTDEAATVRAYGAGGVLITTVNAVNLGNNSFQSVSVNAEGVRRLEIEFSSSGALTGIVFCEGEEDICELDQGPPEVTYSFEEDRFVRLTVTDDTGIASVDITLTDTEGGTPNLELVEENFTPGEMTATFRYRLINFTQNTFVRVVATDLCDLQQCPDTDQFPDESPFVSINGQGDFATGVVIHPDGLQSLEFFRLINVEVTQNTFVQGNPRADFTVTRLDPTLPTRYGLIAATSCNATVIDPDLSGDFPSGGGAFQETDGMLSVEAESHTGTAEGYDGGENFSWESTGSYAGSSGDALQAMPNAGANAQDTDRGPRLDYAVNFETPGTYYVWARLSGDGSGSNSVHVGLDGEPATYGRNGLDFNGNGDWQWANRVNGRRGADRVRVEVSTPGVHTLNLWMREDGTRVDKIVLVTDRSFRPSGNGPAESTRGGGETTETVSPVYVNFQRSSTSTPAGYLADTGEAFGDRGDDQSFGWSVANYETRERGAVSDKVYDTLNHMQKNGANKSWEIALPNGEYEVRLVMGDPSYSDQVNTVSVEGVMAVDTDGADNFDEHNLVVTVADGRLTISPAQGASNAKLAFVEITPVGGGNAARGAGGVSDTAARGEKDDVEAATPYTFALGQNYPNPFSASTTIDIELPAATEVRLEVFNMLGQRVQVLADGGYEAGPHSFRFDADGLSSGTYLYRITTPDNVSTRRMTVVK